ncbi:hypothetical protein H113_06334 [Trichophyton rubrum MR1459]|uniref:Uncharacterized protein n=1 Tax=Trichophyton rubrum (strain ATCC MYA-4607 / CBS 118892) TaxID=559305 RepID=A0A080WJ59_TRIRC|nr:uncharacterized protein TERG_11744 [Trichophyton rubrum CBS 118892]EZF92893.1 hypothetical protein H113_06334 [Trichophyton rubrum MR1459]EZG03905.1 hypothetical protein H106_06131 [Trichophyton rubrum CBS 735.88]KFL60667.1 hypothetical protein TERG_11744 [Trichophyton rubrum CBS 118892]
MRRVIWIQPQVPFTRHQGLVACIPQELRQGDDSVVQVAFIPRLAALELGLILAHRPQAGDVYTVEGARGLPVSLSIPLGGHRCIYGANGSGVQHVFTVISAREQHRTRGRAGSRCVEVCESHSSVAGDAVDVRCLDLAAEAACIREAQVIGDNHKEIRS